MSARITGAKLDVRSGHRKMTSDFDFYGTDEDRAETLRLIQAYAAGARAAGFDVKILVERTTEEEVPK